MRQINPVVEVASGEYDRRKKAGIYYPGIELVAGKFGISGKALQNYRSNYISRKGKRPRVG